MYKDIIFNLSIDLIMLCMGSITIMLIYNGYLELKSHLQSKKELWFFRIFYALGGCFCVFLVGYGIYVVHFLSESEF